MFILDSDIRAGAMRVAVKQDKVSTIGDLHDQAGDEYVYYPTTRTQILGYQTTGPMGFQIVDGTALRWHRMSDASLVGCWNVGVSGSPFSFDYELRGISNRGKKASPAPSYDFPGDIASYYYAATLDGGRYRVMMQSCHGSGNEWDKYVAPTGKENWNLSSHVFIDPAKYGSNSDFYYVDQGGVKYDQTYQLHADDTPEFSIRLVAYPDGSAPAFSSDSVNLGTITSPQVVEVGIANATSATASFDGGPETSAGISGGFVRVDLSSWWSSASFGSHTIVLRATGGGWSAGCRVKFVKSSDAVSVTTKPHSSANRPTSCRLVGNLVVPKGAVLTQEVTNNGNDASPTWEVYTGNEHFFENAEKTASQWGLAARVSIDNSDGNAVAEIKDSLAMGVLYEGGAE